MKASGLQALPVIVPSPTGEVAVCEPASLMAIHSRHVHEAANHDNRAATKRGYGPHCIGTRPNAENLQKCCCTSCCAEPCRSRDRGYSLSCIRLWIQHVTTCCSCAISRCKRQESVSCYSPQINVWTYTYKKFARRTNRAESSSPSMKSTKTRHLHRPSFKNSSRVRRTTFSKRSCQRKRRTT